MTVNGRTMMSSAMASNLSPLSLPIAVTFESSLVLFHFRLFTRALSLSLSHSAT